MAGLDDPDEETWRYCAWGLSQWDTMTAERVRVVLQRMAQAKDDLAEFLAYAVCQSREALPEVAFLHDTLRTHKNQKLRGTATLRLGRLKVDDPVVLADAASGTVRRQRKSPHSGGVSNPKPGTSSVAAVA